MAKKTKDLEATRAAKFLNRASRINFDGTVELHGRDMEALRAEVFARDGYKCVECASPEWPQLDHIVRRSLGRDDRAANCRVLCVTCHAARHPRVKWSEKVEA